MTTAKDCVMALCIGIGVALFFLSIGVAFDMYGRQETQRQLNCIEAGGSWQLSTPHDEDSIQEFECKVPVPNEITVDR